MFLPPIAKARTRTQVQRTLDQTVTLLAPGSTSVSGDGFDEPSASVPGVSIRAAVFPEARDARIAADRPEGVNGYTVRMARTSETAGIDHTYQLLWSRTAHRGGDVTLYVVSATENRGEGRFVVLACEART